MITKRGNFLTIFDLFPKIYNVLKKFKGQIRFRDEKSIRHEHSHSGKSWIEKDSAIVVIQE